MIRHFWFLSGFPIEENKNYVAGSIIFLALFNVSGCDAYLLNNLLISKDLFKSYNKDLFL